MQYYLPKYPHGRAGWGRASCRITDFCHILLKLSGFPCDHSGCVLTALNINATGTCIVFSGPFGVQNTGFWRLSSTQILMARPGTRMQCHERCTLLFREYIRQVILHLCAQITRPLSSTCRLGSRGIFSGVSWRETGPLA